MARLRPQATLWAMTEASLDAEDASADWLVVGGPTPRRGLATRDNHSEFERTRSWGLQLPKAEV